MSVFTTPTPSSMMLGDFNPQMISGESDCLLSLKLHVTSDASV